MEQYLQQLDKINQYLDFERQKGEKQRNTETLQQFVTMKGGITDDILDRHGILNYRVGRTHTPNYMDATVRRI